MTRLEELGEFELIRRLTANLRLGPDVREGPGDDAAVVRPDPGRDLVITNDALISGRHWLDEWIEPADLGARLALANLSDVAAMAARPRWAVIAMGLKPDRLEAWVSAVQSGVESTLARENAWLVGGNLGSVELQEWLCLTLIGDVQPERAWTRRGARAGDLIAVTGSPGRAGAAPRLIRRLGAGARAAEWSPLLEAWRRPTPRVDFARALAASGVVVAAIDLSDGVAGDLGHLCAAGGVGAELEASAWGDDPPLEAAARTLSVPLEELRAGASDDYELLLAVRAPGRATCEAVAREAGVPLHFVGRFTPKPGAIEWLGNGARRPLRARGFEHFV